MERIIVEVVVGGGLGVRGRMRKIHDSVDGFIHVVGRLSSHAFDISTSVTLKSTSYFITSNYANSKRYALILMPSVRCHALIMPPDS